MKALPLCYEASALLLCPSLSVFIKQNSSIGNNKNIRVIFVPSIFGSSTAPKIRFDVVVIQSDVTAPLFSFKISKIIFNKLREQKFEAILKDLFG